MNNTSVVLRRSRGLFVVLVVTILLALVTGRESPTRPHDETIEETAR